MLHVCIIVYYTVMRYNITETFAYTGCPKKVKHSIFVTFIFENIAYCILLSSDKTSSEKNDTKIIWLVR